MLAAGLEEFPIRAGLTQGIGRLLHTDAAFTGLLKLRGDQRAAIKGG